EPSMPELSDFEQLKIDLANPQKRAEMQAAAKKFLAEQSKAPLVRKSARPLSPRPFSGGDLVDVLCDGNAKVFTDVAGEEWFRWPDLPDSMRTEENHPNYLPFECLIPFPSRQLRAFLTTWIYVDDIGPLQPGALNEALLILEGLAFINRARCDLGTAIEV